MQSSIDIVRGLYDALARDDLEGVIAKFADDCEIVMMGPSSIPFAGTYQGARGMREFLDRYLRDAEIVELAPDEFHGAEEFVTVLGHERARSKQTGREWNTRLVDTYVVRDDKIRRFVCAYDTAAVAEAFAGSAPTRTTEPSERARA